ncbi:MAG: Rrf2 family transcriptional regulator [Thermoanaerobaculales bacterium]|jgi:Rrf2 family protein|nr:Rrf2 family transcriptional regulator [Thermoanaerobaculales bacterium]
MNRTERYRLEALVELAHSYPAGRSTAEISRSREIPQAYLSRLLAELARAGWVESRRGPSGGVALARPPAAIPLSSVIPARRANGDLPPALDRLAGAIDRAIDSATRRLSVADLARWDRQTTREPDYSI